MTHIILILQCVVVKNLTKFIDNCSNQKQLFSIFHSTGEPADQSSHSFVQIEREAYPPPPSRVQLERTRGPADPDEDLDTQTGHRRSYSMPSERLEVEV